MTPTITGGVEPGDDAEHGDGDEEHDLEEEPRDRETASSRRVDRSHPGRSLADGDRGAVVPPVAIRLARRKRVGLRPERVDVVLQAADLRRERAHGADELGIVLGRLAGDLRSSRTGPPRRPGQPSSVDFISSSAARPCSCTSARRSVTDAAGGSSTSSAAAVVARLGELASELVGGIGCGRRRRRDRLSFPAALPPAPERVDAERDDGELDELAHGGDGTAAVRPRLLPSRGFLPRHGSVRSRRRHDR